MTSNPQPSRNALDWLIEIDRLLTICRDIQVNSPLHREIIRFIKCQDERIKDDGSDLHTLAHEAATAVFNAMTRRAAPPAFMDIATEAVRKFIIENKLQSPVQVDRDDLVRMAYLEGVLRTTNCPISQPKEISDMIIGMPEKSADNDEKIKWFNKHYNAIRNTISSPNQQEKNDG